MKLMYALWGSELEQKLHTTSLHESLRAAGVTTLNVNVDDADVAPTKLRISTFAEPVGAVVSVWTESDPEAASVVLSSLVERCSGWEVEEKVRLDPPQSRQGERTAALAQFALLRIPPMMSADEWLLEWQGRHTRVAIVTQDTFGYVQNRVVRQVHGSDWVDALVEELFVMEAMTDPHAFYGSGGDQAELDRRLGLMIESVVRFGAHENLDSIPTSRYVYDLTD